MDEGSKNRRYLAFFILLLIACPTGSLEPQSEMFRLTTYCIRSGNVIATVYELFPVRCAARCASTDRCEGLSYNKDSSSCRLAAVTAGSEMTDSNCITEESVFLSDPIHSSSCNLTDGWYHNPDRNKCIKMFLTAKTHQEALDDCQTRGAKLAIISTLETRDVYAALINGDNQDWTGASGGIWTDAVLDSGTIMSFRWSDGTNVITDMWAPGEPHGNECTQLWFSPMLLDDIHCTDTRQYVCEKPPQLIYN